jgi:hypothetical protein
LCVVVVCCCCCVLFPAKKATVDKTPSDACHTSG